jgi:hypothetical protein
MKTPQWASKRQKGAALVVGLVLMMVLTILAVSTMRTATLELLMAGNAQYKAKAFQLAETGLRDAVNQINEGSLALDATEGWENLGALTGSVDDTGDDYVVDVRFLRAGDPPPSYSEGGEITALYFELTSTGQTIARGAKSVQTQGFWTIQ